jgi:8-oxo-dGTP pyrophosphatase MutT (NUDIX family)
MSPFMMRLRALIGHELLLLPSVAILPWDTDGCLLMVRNFDTGQWQTIGGVIEPDESPREAAIREVREEAGIDVELLGLRDVVGGPDYRVLYPNGDQVAYVSTVFDARMIGGALHADGEETSEARWLSMEELSHSDMDSFTWTMLLELGVLTRKPASAP